MGITKKYIAKARKSFISSKMKLYNFIDGKFSHNYGRNYYIIKLIERDLDKLDALEKFRRKRCSRKKAGLEYCRNRNFYNKTVNNVILDIIEKLNYYSIIDSEIDISSKNIRKQNDVHESNFIYT